MKSIKFTLLILLSFIPLIFSISFAESENYCHDKESWREWDALVEKNPNDMEVQALHALRIGLCVKVDRGGITLEHVTDIFESARDAIVQNRRQNQRRIQVRKKL